MYDALDGDPYEPNDRNEVLLNVNSGALRALHAWRRQMKDTGSRGLAIVGTVTYFHV